MHERQIRLAWLIGATLLIGACGARAEPTSPPDTSAVPTSAATAPAPSEADWARVGEAIRLMGDAGSDVWAGWGDSLPPMILETEQDDWIVAAPPGIDGLVAAPDLEVEGFDVRRRPGRLVPGIGVQKLASGYAVAILPRPELQSLVDRVLGEGAITLDEVEYVRWIVHESFHVFEIEAMSGSLPLFGFTGSDMALVEELSAVPGHLDGVARDGELLLAALRSTGDEETIAAIRRFFEARAERRSTVDEQVVALERGVEWTEGLARYADVRLLQAAGSEYTPSAGFLGLGAGYPEAEATWEDAIAWLADLHQVPGTLRDWHYELGAAQAYLLDRVMPGWQPRALPGGEALEDLLAEAVAAADAGIPATLRALPQETVELAGQRLRVAIADTPDSWSRGLAGVRSLGPLDGLLFVFPDAVEAAFFMRGAVMPLDVAFVDADRRVTAVATMALCDADPCPTYESPTPYRWALEADAGALSGTDPGALLTFDP